MVHGQDRRVTALHSWQTPHKAYHKVCRVFRDRGYETIHALKTAYDDTRWVIVHEIQNRDTLSCFYLCYLAGIHGGVYEPSHNGGVHLVSAQRMDMSLHAIPPTGLWFWSAIDAAGFRFPDQTMLESMRREF